MDKKKTKILLYERIGIVLFSAFIFTFIIFGSNTRTDIIYRIIGVLFCIYEFFHIIKRKKLIIHTYLILLISFCLYTLLTSVLYFKSASGMILSLYILLYIGVSFFGYSFFSSIKNGREKLKNILCINGIVLSFYVLFYYGIINYFNLLLAGKRVGQDITNVNMIGINLTLSILIILYDFIINNKKRKLFFLLPLIIVALGTGSKKVIIISFIGLILIFYLKFKEKITKKDFVKIIMIIMVIIITIIALSKMQIFDTVFNRFNTMFTSLVTTGEMDEENKIRTEFIHIGIETFHKHPLLGVGFSNSHSVLMETYGWATYFHNNYVELLATTGFIGTFIFYLTYFVSIRKNYQEIKNKNSYLCSFIIVLIILQLFMDYGMVSNQLPFIYIYLLLWNLEGREQSSENN